MRLPESRLTDMVFGDWRMYFDPYEGARHQHALFGPAVYQKWGPLPVVNLYGPDANQFVLQNRGEVFSNRRAWNLIIGEVFANGLMLRDGDDHRLHRRIMRAGFTKPALTTYLDRMFPLLERAVARTHGELDTYPWLKLLTLELAWNIFVGESSGKRQRRLNDAFEETVAASLALIKVNVPPFLLWRGMRARRYLLDYFGELLAKKRRHPGDDMFGLLARAETEDGHRFSDREVLDHMVFLMMAAHDTTTSTLASLLYELAAHPEWQERCRNEVAALPPGPPSVKDLDRLVYVDAAICEALRLYPPLPVMPKMTNEAVEFDGYRIPANVVVSIHPAFTHRMPEYWTDAHRFDPSRFLPPREEHKQHHFLFIPFSAGAHLCLGKQFAEIQMKAFMVALLRQRSFHTRPGYEMPYTRIPLAKPTDGLPLEFRRLRMN